jgi:hypothetical protein
MQEDRVQNEWWLENPELTKEENEAKRREMEFYSLFEQLHSNEASNGVVRWIN